MKYRAEIDGLRALAVVPVILFHAGIGIFKGGFVGVDIFFVISGYLITSIIIKELDDGSFSIAKFYERRARRILPALFLVILACVPFAWTWLPSVKFNDFFQSTVAVLLFASNILFWREADYFDTSAEEKPLLHTWSLAVEEQYYVIFPLALLLLWRYGRRTSFAFVVAMAALSLLLCEWGWRNQPSANFYLAPFRAWELLAGSICAFMQTHRPQRPSNPLAITGVALIAFAIFRFDESTPFPSLYALVPVLGASLIILYATASTRVGWLLSTPPFVGMGLISYSAYLWHQPFFAFARARSLHEPPQHLMVGLAMLSIVAAYLSWKYVETPFRRPHRETSRPRATPLWPLAAAASLVAALSLLSIPARAVIYRENANADDSEIINVTGLAPNCESTALTDCKTAPEPRILVWGDSYAMQIVPAVRAMFPNAGIAQYTKSACNPIVGISPLPMGTGTDWPNACLRFNRELAKVLDENKSIDTVVISTPMINLLTGTYITANGSSHAAGETDTLKSEAVATFNYLASRRLKIYVVSPPPWPSYGLAGDCARKEILLYGAVGSCNYSPNSASNDTKIVMTFFQEVMNDKELKAKVTFVDLTNVFCGGAICRVGHQDKAFYGNGGHLSMHGSLELTRNRYFTAKFQD